MKPPRNLTPEELRLWQEMTRGDKKLRPKDAMPVVEEMAIPPKKQKTPAATLHVTLPSTPAKRSPALPPLICGRYDGVNAATVRRIKRGQVPVDARLDLHGHTQASALDALVDAVETLRRRQGRLLLVITGKGRTGIAGKTGVLKAALPQWVNLPPLRAHLLAFDIATQVQGGSGAYLLLLKK